MEHGPALLPLASCDAPASMDSWDLLNGFVEDQSELVLGSSSAAYKLRLACEELFSNIIRHAGAGAGCTHIWLRSFKDGQRDKALIIEIEDNGSAFDPGFNSAPSVDLSQPIEQRPIGGLGLYLVRTSVDHVSYVWANQHNHYRLMSSVH